MFVAGLLDLRDDSSVVVRVERHHEELRAGLLAEPVGIGVEHVQVGHHRIGRPDAHFDREHQGHEDHPEHEVLERKTEIDDREGRQQRNEDLSDRDGERGDQTDPQHRRHGRHRGSARGLAAKQREPVALDEVGSGPQRNRIAGCDLFGRLRRSGRQNGPAAPPGRHAPTARRWCGRGRAPGCLRPARAPGARHGEGGGSGLRSWVSSSSGSVNSSCLLIIVYCILDHCSSDLMDGISSSRSTRQKTLRDPALHSRIQAGLGGPLRGMSAELKIETRPRRASSQFPGDTRA